VGGRVFLIGCVVSFQGGGACRGRWSSPRPENERGKKGTEKVVGKAAGDERIFIPGQGSGLVDEASPGAIPGAAAGECHVIHRYISDLVTFLSSTSIL
jgi:hypothetical protein